MRVGKTWRSRKGGAWMAEPSMLERRGGAGKVVLGWWSRVCWEQTLAEAEPQKLGLDGGAVRVGKTWQSRKGGAWMAEPCLLGTEGGAGKPLDECEKQNQNQPKKLHGRQKEAKTVGTNVCGSKTLVARKKTKFGNYSFFSGNKRFAEQTLAEAEPQKLGLDGGAVRVGKMWRSRKGGAWMAEPCLLGTEGGAGTQLDEV